MRTRLTTLFDLDVPPVQAPMAGGPGSGELHLGAPASTDVEALHRAGCVVIGTATTVAEAEELERLDGDVICASPPKPAPTASASIRCCRRWTTSPADQAIVADGTPRRRDP